MIYYRIALQGSQSATWRWKSSPFTSLDGVLGLLNVGQPGPAFHRHHCRAALGQALHELDRGEAFGDGTRRRRRS